VVAAKTGEIQQWKKDGKGWLVAHEAVIRLVLKGRADRLEPKIDEVHGALKDADQQQQERTSNKSLSSLNYRKRSQPMNERLSS
jgi:hypothetical protein